MSHPTTNEYGLRISLLDLLSRLRSVKEAFYDHASSASEMCMDGTRQTLLAELTAWFENAEPSAPRVFWLNGLAGTGKTTVARTMADWAHQRGRLAATFFFSRNIDATRVPSAIIPTLGISRRLGRRYAQASPPMKTFVTGPSPAKQRLSSATFHLLLLRAHRCLLCLMR
jgi:predicted alpha/beta-fold hydrolase